MWNNYLKIALRNLLKSKLHSTINIVGLAVGLAAVVLISLYIKDETSYDKFHKDADDIYRIAWWTDNPQTRTPHPMAQALVDDFPQIESAVSLSPIWGSGLTKQTFSIRNIENDITFDEAGLLSVDSTFFDVFSFNLVKGNKDEMLRNIGGLLISETTAKKYFGEDDPIGQRLAINNDETLLFVEGVFEDVPPNSHFHFDMLISYVSMKAFEDENDPYYTWADFGHFNYIKLTENADPDALENQLMEWAKSYVQVSEEEMQQAVAEGIHFKLQRLTDIHLESRIRWELEANGNKEYVYIMTAAALLILVMACVNFMNLTTAKSTGRSKEIGIRKSLGAFKSQVGLQFLGESVLTALLAMLLAGVLAEVSIPWFNVVTGKALNIQYFEQPGHSLILVGTTLFTGLVAGLYPSVFLSSVHPVISLKGIEKLKPKGGLFRKSLIVFQFVISMILLSGSVVIYNQLQFIQGKDLGFDTDQVVTVPLKNYGLIDRFEAMQNELKNVDGVSLVSAASNIPGKQFNQNSISLARDLQRTVSSSEVMIDYDYFDVLGLEFIEGRGFSRAYSSDSGSFVINEVAAKNLGLEAAVGEEIIWSWDNDGRPPVKGRIIGVVSDFNYNSLHEPVRPLLFYLSPGFNQIVLKVEGEKFNEIMANVEDVWTQFEDRFGFEYSVLSDDIGQQYLGEQRTAKVFGGFSFIAVLIACFGLFGVASLSFSQRLREVGIRKVMGASTFKILKLLLGDFTNLIMISMILAVPLAWFIMNGWLQNFTYKIELGATGFIVSGLALMVIAFLTLSYLTIKTANSNPINSLKED